MVFQFDDDDLGDALEEDECLPTINPGNEPQEGLEEELRGPLTAIHAMRDPFMKHAESLVSKSSDDDIFATILANNCALINEVIPVLQFTRQFANCYQDEINSNMYMIRVGNVMINKGKASIILVPDEEEKLFHKNIRPPKMEESKAGFYNVDQEMEPFKKKYMSSVKGEITCLSKRATGLTMGRVDHHFRLNKFLWKHLRNGNRQVRKSRTVNKKKTRYWDSDTAGWCSLGWSIVLKTVDMKYPYDVRVSMSNEEREKIWMGMVRALTIRKLKEFSYDLKMNPTEARQCIVREMPRTLRWLKARGKRPRWTLPIKKRKGSDKEKALRKTVKRVRRKSRVKQTPVGSQKAKTVDLLEPLDKKEKDTPATSLNKTLQTFNIGAAQKALVEKKSGSLFGERLNEFLFKAKST